MTFELRACGLSDVGRSRAVNEDAFAMVPSLGLFLVADGMGGHGHGDVASTLAVEAIVDHLKQEQRGRGGSWRWPRSSESLADRLKRAFDYANDRLLSAMDKESSLSGMGTTAVAFLLEGDRGVIAHVGDSRAYRLRGGALELLTTDHSWVAEQVTAGVLSEDQARVHPLKSVVTRALGSEREVAVEILELSVAAGDLYLLCSDGLTGMVSDERIQARLASVDGLDTRCRGLVEDANRGGGRDNITAVLLSAESG